MREIIVAKNAGFCFGVRRAVDMALKSAGEGQNIFTYGDIIHNEHVTAQLASYGIKAINDLSLLDWMEKTSVVIRSHGAPKWVYDELSLKGAGIIDATCPYVLKIHETVAKANSQKRPVIIVGAKNHAEVVGIEGWANESYTIYNYSDMDAMPVLFRPVVVSQTTMTQARWKAVTRALIQRNKVIEPEFIMSICPTTRERQEEAAALAKKSAACVVVGGKKSSNTRKLYEICLKTCKYTFYVDNIDELSLELLPIDGIISVIAGASTPDWLIREVTKQMSEQEMILGGANAGNGTVETSLEPEAVVTTAVDTAIEANAEVAGAEETADAGTQSQEDKPEGETQTEQSQQAAPATAEENEFLSGLDKSFVKLKRGQTVRGKVVQITDDEACVNVGYKSDGIINRAELTAEGSVNPKDVLNIGDEIDVEVLTLNDGQGNVVLSKKRVDARAKWVAFCNAIDESNVYMCKITGVVKGGLIGRTEGYETFIPASQVDLRFVDDLSKYNGQELGVIVKECDKKQKRLVASHKEVLLKEAAEKEAQVWSSFNKGDVVDGTVKRLSNFGAFVDIGGVDGLLHIRDISWNNIKHPSDVLKEGDEIKVLILNTAPDKKRISLGYKQLQPKPWDLAPEKYLVGSDVTGKVVRIVPFGAFVELEPGIDGLIHISQVANRRIERVEDELKVGDEVTVRVLEVNTAKRKISLSRRVLLNEARSNEPAKKEEIDDDEKYVIPEVEQLGVTLADFFPKSEE